MKSIRSQSIIIACVISLFFSYWNTTSAQSIPSFNGQMLYEFETSIFDPPAQRVFDIGDVDGDGVHEFGMLVFESNLSPTSSAFTMAVRSGGHGRELFVVTGIVDLIAAASLGDIDASPGDEFVILDRNGLRIYGGASGALIVQNATNFNEPQRHQMLVVADRTNDQIKDIQISSLSPGGSTAWTSYYSGSDAQFIPGSNTPVITYANRFPYFSLNDLVEIGDVDADGVQDFSYRLFYLYEPNPETSIISGQNGAELARLTPSDIGYPVPLCPAGDINGIPGDEFITVDRMTGAVTLSSLNNINYQTFTNDPGNPRVSFMSDSRGIICTESGLFAVMGTRNAYSVYHASILNPLFRTSFELPNGVDLRTHIKGFAKVGSSGFDEIVLAGVQNSPFGPPNIRVLSLEESVNYVGAGRSSTGAPVSLFSSPPSESAGSITFDLFGAPVGSFASIVVGSYHSGLPEFVNGLGIYSFIDLSQPTNFTGLTLAPNGNGSITVPITTTPIGSTIAAQVIIIEPNGSISTSNALKLVVGP